MLVEEQKIEEVKQEAPVAPEAQVNQDPAAQAAHHMPAMLAYFKNMVGDNTEFCGNHAKKVLVALSEAPFMDKPHFTTQLQEEVYQLGIRIEQAKFVILMASLRDAAKTKKEESEKQENKEETKEEVKNG